jgi:hypothetical protein
LGHSPPRGHGEEPRTSRKPDESRVLALQSRYSGRLVAIPEGRCRGSNDEVLDVDHAEFARTCAIDIPGPETDRLGRLARNWGVFIMAQAKARHEDWPDRFFNVGFVVDPDGSVLKHYKISALLPCERSIPRTIYSTGGSRNTGAPCRRSGRSPILRSGGSGS